MRWFLAVVFVVFLSSCTSQAVIEPEEPVVIESEDWFKWENIEEELKKIAADLFNEMKNNPVASYQPIITPRTMLSSPVSLSSASQITRYASVRLYLSVRHPRTNEIVNEAIQIFSRLYGSPDINLNATTAELNSKVPFSLIAGPALSHRWRCSSWFEEAAVIRSNNINSFPYILIELTFTEESLLN